MDEAAFRKHLKSRGKKDHVIDGLIAQIRQYACFVEQEKGKSLESACEQDFLDYSDQVEKADPGRLSNKIRGIAMYYSFTGNRAMAELIAGMREKGIAKTRKVFRLKDFRGVNQEDIEKLAAAGIDNVERMLEAGKTPELRKRLSTETGISAQAILELVKLSDLSRLGAIKEVRARLYYDAGVDTPEKFASWEPEALREMLVEFVNRTGFDGIAPLPKEIRNGVETARKSKKIVQY